MTRNFFYIALAIVVSFIAGGSGYTAELTGPVPGRFVVKLTQTADPQRLTLSLSSEEALRPAFRTVVDPQAKRAEQLSRIYILTSPEKSLTATSLTSRFGKENIEWIEPDYYLEFFDVPSDSLFPIQWHLLNDGQEYLGINRVEGPFNDELVVKSGTAGADINIRGEYQSPPAESTRVVVGIVDTGVDTDHPELAGRIWLNADEIPNNNIDDDHNGYVDDIHGYDISGDSVDFFNPEGDNDPSDADGHGTHIAGIVAANADGKGVVGVAPWVDILPVKIRPNGTSAIGAEGVIYAVNAGARVINISWGTPFQSQVLREALDYARSNGVLLCIAPGNSGDNTRFYPAGFDLDSTMIVGAGNSDGYQTYFSTYGEHIDIIAPGLDILSLRAEGTDQYAPAPTFEPDVRIIDSLYYLSDGTSMATPMVVGAAAYIWGVRPDVSLTDIVTILKQGARDLVDPLDRGDTLPGPDSLSGWGYLDLGNSLALANYGGMYITSPDHRSRHTSDIVIKGATVGGYNGDWTLEYTTGLSPDSTAVWQPLAFGTGLPVDSILYTFADPLINDFVNFRLAFAGGHHSARVTITYTRDNTLELTSPVNGQEVEYGIPIYGSANGPDYDSLAVKFRDPGGAIVHLFTSTAEYYDSLIFDWSTSGSDTGSYGVYLFGYFGTGTVLDSARVEIASSFANGWPRSLPGRAGISPIVCDLDRDGIKEIAVATSAGLTLFRADNGEPVPGFPAAMGTDVRCVPAVYDIDADGMDEIIVTDSGFVHAFNHDGTPVTGFPVKTTTGLIPYEYAYPEPTIARLRVAAEPGAVPDSAIMFVNSLGELRAYRFNGDPYFFSRHYFGRFDARVSYSYGLGGGVAPALAAADLNNDDRIEIMGTFSSPLPHTGLAVFDGANGRPMYGIDSPTVQRMREGMGLVVADVDGDGESEVITSGIGEDFKQHLYVVNSLGETVADWVIPIDTTWNGWLASTPTVADLDLDGSPEILSAYFEYDKSSLFIYNTDGSPYLERRPGRPEGEAYFSNQVTLAAPAVADITGDQFPEIIMRSGHLLPGTGTEQLHILNHIAEPLSGWPKDTPARRNLVASSRYIPLVDDIDNDGLVEVVLISDGIEILAWDFDAVYDGERTHYRHLGDNHNSNQWHPAVPPGSVSARPSKTSAAGEDALTNYPDPLVDSRAVSFELTAPERVRLEVFDVSGESVAVLVNEDYGVGEHAITVNASVYDTGIYFYRLSAGDRVLQKKMLFVK